MFTRLASPHLIAAVTLSLGLAGCAAEQDLLDETFTDADQIASSLELENGGLDMADEEPMFADIALFEDAELIDANEVAFDDAMERDENVRAILGDVDAVLFHTTVMWGQIPGNRENTTPYNWSGQLSVNRGAILVRSVLAFDGRFDRLAPRNDPKVVNFRAATLPHRDGLRLLVVDPNPTSDEPLVLTYTQVDGDSFSVPMAEILGQPKAQEMDDAGNQIVAVAMPQLVDVCENGFLQGRWHRVANHRGRILGRVVDSEGTPMGHVRGVYGQKNNGDKVFFMKFINRDGQFRGILRGGYGEGHFLGRWMTRAGEHGALGGQYRESDRVRGVGGQFLGRWVERSCNLDING